MTDVAHTPAATLTRAREIARDAGLNYVYTGNVHDESGGSTYCPSCAHPLIRRDWYQINSYELTDAGACKQCGTQIPGRFQRFSKAFGPRRIPVRLAA
jgi:pyruvate formate lyase activating enzyme